MSGSVDTDTVGNMDDRAWPVAAAAATAAVGSPVTGTTCDDSALSTLAPSLVDMHVKWSGSTSSSPWCAMRDIRYCPLSEGTSKSCRPKYDKEHRVKLMHNIIIIIGIISSLPSWNKLYLCFYCYCHQQHH